MDTRRPAIVLAALLLALPAAPACEGDGGGGGAGDTAAPDTLEDTAADDTSGADAAPDADDDAAPDAAADADTGPAPVPRVDLVDLLVGTGTIGINFAALFPGPKRPFGMVALSPDTGGTVGPGFSAAQAAGYFYDDLYVRGFSHIHLAGTGVADYGVFAVLPALGDPAAHVASGALPYLPLDHAREVAEVGYYRLDSDDVRAEVTATDRAGVHRYTFQGPDGALVFDLSHTLGGGEITDSAATVDPATGELRGFVHNVGDFSDRFGGFSLYFVARPDRAPASVGTWDAGGWAEGGTSTGGPGAGVALRFDTATDADVVLRVGISFVDEDGAEANLDAEAEGRAFDDIRAESRAVWEDALSVVTVEGGTEARRRMLYTTLYRTMMMPTLYTDVDGRYRGLDKEVHVAEGFTYYSDFSMWDTYRTTHPLFTLLLPERQRDFLRSLTRMALEGGSMPQWPLSIGYTGSMIGTSADVVIGDAVDKGITDFDLDAAWEKMWALANGPPPPGRPGRDEVTEWLAHGYVPADVGSGSVSKTLEYATDDACLARMAEHLGKAEDAEMLRDRATWWLNLWDPDKGFVAPHNADGTLVDYTPTKGSSHYVEGTPWHYVFMVPHDVPALVELMGGAETFVERLEYFMTKGREELELLGIGLPSTWYWHGNEPDILAPWLFGFGGRPELTRTWTTWAADSVYRLEPGGFAGNDDGGTLAAWYVFAAAGIYPLTCTGRYALSAPLFDRVTWRLAGGDLVVVRGDDPAGPVRLDGAVYDSHLVAHHALLGGVTLELPPAPAEDAPR